MKKRHPSLLLTILSLGPGSSIELASGEGRRDYGFSLFCLLATNRSDIRHARNVECCGGALAMGRCFWVVGTVKHARSSNAPRSVRADADSVNQPAVSQEIRSTRRRCRSAKLTVSGTWYCNPPSRRMLHGGRCWWASQRLRHGNPIRTCEGKDCCKVTTSLTRFTWACST
jgi:hypothetical protein